MTRPNRLSIEALEARDVPTGITFLNGTYRITGGEGPDVATVYDRGLDVEIVARFGDGRVESVRRSGTAVNRIIFDGGADGDSFTNLTGEACIAFGRGGNDVLQGGSGADVLLGGGDDDDLRGRGGNDYLDGGLGQDDLDGGTQNDWLVTDGADSQAVNGRRVHLAADPSVVWIANGPKWALVSAVSRVAESEPGVPFDAVDETATLSREQLAGILFPVFVGQ